MRRIAGVDEVGRGALAGPLVVAAVVLDHKHLHDLELLQLLAEFRNKTPKKLTKKQKLAKIKQNLKKGEKATNNKESKENAFSDFWEQNNKNQQISDFELNLQKTSKNKKIRNLRKNRDFEKNEDFKESTILQKNEDFENNWQNMHFSQKFKKIPNYEIFDILQNYSDIKDSKKLSQKMREKLNNFIKHVCTDFCIVEISHDAIDNVGISGATQMGFFNSIQGLGGLSGSAVMNELSRDQGSVFSAVGADSKASSAKDTKDTQGIDHIFTDAFAINALKPDYQTNLIGGDNVSLSIAAASIIAKVYRDCLMIELATHKKYEMYGFDKHKGYGTKVHRDSIFEHGPSDIHRKSFEPVKGLLEF